MIPRKKRRLILIISIVLIILILLIAFALVYINTDMFKSNKMLFMKYLGKNVQNINEAYTQINQKTDYENSLEQSKYTVNTQINVNNTENLGTTQENTDNVINQLKVVADGQVDKANQFNYQKVNLYKGEDSLLGLEFIQNSNIYGLRFSDLFQQFLLVDSNNLQDLFNKLGYSNEEISNMPSQSGQLSIGSIEMTDEEEETLVNKYIEIIENDVTNQNFSKQENQTIEIDGKSVQVNAYTVTLTKEQLNNIYLDVFEQLKSDEIILGKLDELQKEIEQINQIFQNSDSSTDNNSQNLKDIFVTQIDDIISKINQNNIGQDETTITVYENMKNTVRTSIQTPEYEIDVDFLTTEGERFIQYSGNDKSNDTIRTISLSETNNNIEMNIDVVEGEEEKSAVITQNKEISGNTMKKSLTAQYEDSENRVEAYITQNYQIVTQFRDEIVLDGENAIQLDDLEQAELKSLMTTVTLGVNDEMMELQNMINMQELQQVLINAQLLDEKQNLVSNGTTETEKTRYNSQFEMLKGKNLESERILNAINATQNYITNLEVISNTELRIELSRNENNPEIVTTLQTFIEDHGREIYNLDVEYDEQTGLVSSLLLTIVTDE